METPPVLISRFKLRPKIGHCEGLKNMVKNPDALAALKQCKIESKELILLLPQHVRNEMQPTQMYERDNANPATSSQQVVHKED